jgi:hypothetical protein
VVDFRNQIMRQAPKALLVACAILPAGIRAEPIPVGGATDSSAGVLLQQAMIYEALT